MMTISQKSYYKEIKILSKKIQIKQIIYFFVLYIHFLENINLFDVV